MAPRTQRPGSRRPDLVRRTAFDVVRAVSQRDAYANLLLPSLLRERGIGGRDAALATELAYGTLRGLGTYDAVIAACSDRPLPTTDRSQRGKSPIDPVLLDVLRIGAHQVLGTRIPPHAAVGTTVDLARSAAGPGQARFANAVLRKIAGRDREAWLTIVAPPMAEDRIGHLAVVHSHPRWIVKALREAVGDEELADLLAADNTRPRVTLVARPGLASVEELEGYGCTPGTYSPFAAYLSEGDPRDVPAVADGRAGVQDEASQLVALALAAAPLAGGDDRWLDMCAGPGGKAALLAGLGRGARLLACDVRPARAGLVRNTIAGRAAVAVVDGTRPAWKPGTFDRVLVDAPCTGLGALRRRPEARWRRAATDLPALTRLQRALLGSALAAVRPGGVVGYATCSPLPAETREVVEAVLGERADVEVLDARASLPGIPDLGDGPYAQFWPHRHGTDAMFLALLRRRG